MCVAQRGALLSGGEGGKFTASPISTGQSQYIATGWSRCWDIKRGPCRQTHS